MKKKVMFICKYNMFRSKIAEAYFKKLHPGHPVRSRGIIAGRTNRHAKEIYLPKKLGLNIQSKPNSIKYSDLEWADLIVVAANNVPAKLFHSKRTNAKVIQWNIPDVYPNTPEMKINDVILQVIRHVDKLKVD
jgi:protein-tyrosine-phosphatase